MIDPERDARYQGFAKLLMDELGDQGFVFEGANDANREEHLEQIKMLIAHHMAKCQEETKQPVHVLDHATLPIGINIQTMFIKVEYDGKQYTGMLYPMKDEEDNEVRQ